MLARITHAQLPTYLDLAISASENLLLVSAPGVGKTVGIKSYASAENYELILSHPAVWEPTDAKGLPAKGKMIIEKIVKAQSDGEDFDDLMAELDMDEDFETVKEEIECATFLPFDDLLKVLTATKPTIWFLDDLGQAPPLVQAALMQYLEGGELEGRKIPDCVHIVAATNGREHKAGVKGLLEPVKSRFGLILELVPDVESTTTFFQSKGYHHATTDYLNYKPDQLLNFKPNNGMENSPCPRLWEKLAKFLHLIPESSWGADSVKKVCVACIGESTGTEFWAFLSIYHRIPSYNDIVSEPTEYPLDQRADERFAILSMLAVKAERDHAADIFKWVARLRKEYQVFFVRTCHAMENSLMDTPAMRNWTADNANIYTQALSNGDWLNL